MAGDGDRARRGGEYPRKVASHRLIRGFGPVLVLLWISGVLFGFWLARWDVPLVALGALLTLGVLTFLTRFVTRNLESNEKEYVRYARGMQGELLVAWTLSGLSADWHVYDPTVIQRQVMALKERLAAETGTPVRWVRAILAAPFASVDVDGTQIDAHVAALSRIAESQPADRGAVVRQAVATDA